MKNKEQAFEFKKTNSKASQLESCQTIVFRFEIHS